MALTQDQWFTKIKSWVPTWWFEKEQYNVAVFEAMAKVFAEAQAEQEAELAQTFLTEATAPVLDAHGDERSMARLLQEGDQSYSTRIRQFINQADKGSLKTIIDSILVRGTCEIAEGWKDLLFANRGNFLSRNEFLTAYHYNFFTVIVDPQIKSGFSYYSRGNYGSRGNFIGGAKDVSLTYRILVEAINKAKAFGVLYRIVERHAVS